MTEEDAYDFLGTDVSEEKPVEKEEEIDYSDWESASLKELAGALGRKLDEDNRPIPTEIVIPIDPVKRTVFRMWLKELSVNELLIELENFYKVDKKSGDAKPQLRQFYSSMYNKMVERSEPPLAWKNARRLGEKFLAILYKHFPNPLTLSKGLSEEEEKN